MPVVSVQRCLRGGGELARLGERIRRGHTNGPIRVALPAGYLDHLDDLTVPDDADVMALSGG